MKSGARRLDGGAWIGALLIIAGALFLVGEYAQTVYRINPWEYGWPLFVIVPGLVLLAVGASYRGATGLVIPGCIVITTGLILAIQNATGLWATWAYAWALVAPGAAGVGVAIQGLLRRSPSETAAGLRTAAIGLALFIGFGIFFEGFIHLSGFDFGAAGKIIPPAVLIALGIALLIRQARTRPAGQR
jgi:hypothetical protein